MNKMFLYLMLVIMVTVGLTAAPLKSNLAGREIVGIEDGSNLTAKDYIQDGLIAMWDAKENVGWGRHDDTSTTWVDLTGGGRDWSLDSSRCTFTNDALIIMGFCGLGDWTIPMISRTSEVVVSVESTGTACLYQCWSNGRPKCCCIIANSTWVTFDYSSDSWFMGAQWDNIASWHSYSVTDSESFQDAISKPRSRWDYGGTGSKVYSGLGACIQNNAGTSVIWAFKGQCRSIRIYNRYLRQEEIAHNYKIDKVRFNLQ